MTALPASTTLSLTLIVAVGPTLSTSCRDVIVDLLVDSVPSVFDGPVAELPATSAKSTGRDRSHAPGIGYRDLEGIGRRARLGLDREFGTGRRS